MTKKLSTCIFCDRLLVDVETAAPMMPICIYCVQSHPDPRNRAYLVWSASKKATLNLNKLFSLPMLVGAILGPVLLATFAFSTRSISLYDMWDASPLLFGMSMFLWSVMGITFGMIFCLIAKFSKITSIVFQEEKTTLIKTLKLSRAIERSENGANYVWFIWRPPSWFDLTIPLVKGILLETNGGVVFCGAYGSRVVVPYSAVTSVVIERLKLVPRRPAIVATIDESVKINLPKTNVPSTQVTFTFVENEQYSANREKAEQLAARIEECIESSKNSAEIMETDPETIMEIES